MNIQSEHTFFKPRCSYSNSYSPTSFPSPAIPLTPHVSLVPGLLSPVVGVWEGPGDEATLIVTPEGNDVTPRYETIAMCIECTMVLQANDACRGKQVKACLGIHGKLMPWVESSLCSLLS